MSQFLKLKKNIVDHCHFKIFIIGTFVGMSKPYKSLKLFMILDQVMNEKRITGCI
jgi:hypothetical protein